MFYTALLLGFTGSLHCAGMCSPLSIAITKLNRGASINRVIYNSGRILTYGILGALCSMFGSLLAIGTYQTLLSIIFGVVLMVLAIARITDISFMPLSFLSLWIRKIFSQQLSNRNRISIFVMGMVNGILPCGLSAIALSYCVLLSKTVDGFFFMLLFGAATLPMMLGLAPLVIRTIGSMRISVSKATTSMIFLSGLMLIIRTFLHAGLRHPAELVDIVICH